MDSAKDQKHVERLARVRENQRKSRARKQEFVNELEQRLALCKKQAQQKDIEYRLATQKVEAENRHLKALLGSLGVPSASVQQYLHEADTWANTNRKVAIPAIQQVKRDNHLPLLRRDSHRTNLSMAVPRVYRAEPEITELPTAVDSACASTVVQPTDQPPHQTPQEEDPALCGCRSDRQNPETVSDEDVLNSTLCAIAEEMINQYNTKGIDVDEIRRRIWSGFRAGANGTGCRVQNHILFQVLDDISSDV
ncbi:ABSCISIC ACID-INSENSITIVE 5-like protein 5 [Penicillium digitatum]|uniref:ABSCISIC ACID-INSENSITIVE 5-like protein 5 n=1 Tax=Penicillium digitatum TaxID=36651 RepID=A0A7T6XHG6_PENDI|nr:ABSCISIC ACID-INSENSITIVE 5-like protein 5 [Penicillium digitatum]